MASSVARERTTDGMVAATASALAGLGGVALARVWLVGPGDRCTGCAMATDCLDRRRCLHLVASSGSPGALSGAWSRPDGPFQRVPLGHGKVGRVGAAGTGVLMHDASGAALWMTDPAWTRREAIRSFAAQPLVSLGETFGVLDVSSGARLDSTAFGWLRTIADHLAASVAVVRIASRGRGGPRVGANVLEGTSAAVSRLRAQIAGVGASDGPILLAGEPGSGRGEVARAIHAASPRAGHAFVRVHTAGRSARDVAAELVAAPGHGTVFLDEVAALRSEDQARLARVVREGDRAARPTARVIAATARDLASETDAGRFDRDLYVALARSVLGVPSLRERARDVPVLVEQAVADAAERLGVPLPLVEARDLRALGHHAWPGNLRELVAVVEVAVLRAVDGCASFESLLGPTAASSDGVVPAIDMRRRERTNVEAALLRTNGRIYGPDGAATLLGIPPTTLASRMKALGIKAGRRPPG